MKCKFNKDKIYIFPSDNPKWKWEIYNYKGIFISYLGKLKSKDI